MGRPADAISIQEELPAAPASVAAARRLMRRFAGELGVDLDAIELAVSEGVSNAVVHAYEGEDGTVECGPRRRRTSSGS
jgi:anti-sigma regulatory factor (Ser/Thr protein kinase)